MFPKYKNVDLDLQIIFRLHGKHSVTKLWNIRLASSISFKHRNYGVWTVIVSQLNPEIRNTPEGIPQPSLFVWNIVMD